MKKKEIHNIIKQGKKILAKRIRQVIFVKQVKNNGYQGVIKNFVNIF